MLESGLQLALGAGGVGIAGVAGVAYATFAPRARLWCPVISRAVPTAPARIALTFDDGPAPATTPRVLDILARTGTPAAFFIIGRCAEAHPQIVERIHNEGHLLANHSFDHHHTGLFGGRTYWAQQLRRTDEVIESITGAPPSFFRPPMGYKSPPMAWAVRGAGMRTVAWSRRALDGVPTTEDRILRRLLPTSRAGDILALHDGLDPQARWRATDATVEALPHLISGLHQRAIEPVRLDQLLALPPYRTP